MFKTISIDEQNIKKGTFSIIFCIIKFFGFFSNLVMYEPPFLNRILLCDYYLPAEKENLDKINQKIQEEIKQVREGEE